MGFVRLDGIEASRCTKRMRADRPPGREPSLDAAVEVRQATARAAGRAPALHRLVVPRRRSDGALRSPPAPCRALNCASREGPRPARVRGRHFVTLVASGASRCTLPMYSMGFVRLDGIEPSRRTKRMRADRPPGREPSLDAAVEVRQATARAAGRAPALHPGARPARSSTLVIVARSRWERDERCYTPATAMLTPRR
jgi:hypothetical protein